MLVQKKKDQLNSISEVALMMLHILTIGDSATVYDYLSCNVKPVYVLFRNFLLHDTFLVQ